MNFQEKVDYYKYNRQELTKAILLSIFILILIIISFFVFTNFKDEFTKSLETAKNQLTGRYWFIESVTPDETSSTFSLNMKSSVGNIRNYSGVLSYGLSKNGQLLAIHNNEGVFIVSLEDESKKSIKTPQDKFSGDLGEVINWNRNDSYFAIPVLVPNPSHTEVWVYTDKGELYTSIAVNMPVSETGKTIVEPAYFSNKTDVLLLRTYKQDDLDFIQEGATPYSKYNLPIYLNTYSIQGKMIQEFNIRDYDDQGSNMVYMWDHDSNYIKYVIYTGNVPDVTKDYLFTKLAANE